MPSMKRPQWLPRRGDLAGLLLAGALGGGAMALAFVLPKSPLVSDVLLALLLGALVVNTPLRRLVGLETPSSEREPDRYAAGLRFAGKWVLRASIILMGLKVQAGMFSAGEIVLVLGVCAVTLPSTFFLTHAIAPRLGLRRPMADLLAGGTMICGASAVNAIAPVAGARREEQGVAIAAVFLFSVVALLLFRPIASVVGLDSGDAGIWSGLAVNDLSSAIAVGKQMGEPGGTLAAAAKSARILMLAPTLFALAFARRGERATAQSQLGKSAAENLPRFLIGYAALAAVRLVGDPLFEGSSAWATVVLVDKVLVDFSMAMVAASIGLHLDLRRLLATGARALAVGGVASVWMASLTLALVTLAARGQPSAAALVGLVALAVSATLFRASSGKERDERALEGRFEHGAPLSLAEATRLLGALERRAAIDDEILRRILGQLHPSIGELIPVRESPLAHGEGCRWITYWEGKSGWALVAVCREPGSATPIHAHPHRLIGKSIEGMLEELRFREEPGALELVARRVLSHNDLVETDGLATPHLVRALGDRVSIDLQLRGPEVGEPGRRFRADEPLDLGEIVVGARFKATHEVDDRPGQAGEGARAGRLDGLAAFG